MDQWLITYQVAYGNQPPQLYTTIMPKPDPKPLELLELVQTPLINAEPVQVTLWGSQPLEQIPIQPKNS